MGDEAPREGGAAVRAFLIADVRGYTRFTQEHGDIAAARLARKFAELVRKEVSAAGGVLLELRGDEALVVFDSPRQALRTAVVLQARFEQETGTEPTIPLGVGIGVDVGEAVPVEGGYRGGALNLAARLCALAGPGEVFASEGVVHLARKVPGVQYLAHRPVRLKGLDKPVRVVQVVGEGALLQQARQPLRERLPVEMEIPLLNRTIGTRSFGALAGAVLVAVAIGLAFALSGSGGGSQIDANAAGLIDSGSGSLLANVPVGTQPVALASYRGAVWVVDETDDNVARVDSKARTVRDLIPVGSSPAGIAAGAGALWVTNSERNTVSEVNPDANRVVQTIPVGTGPGAVAFGGGAVWVANSLDGTVSEIAPASGRVTRTIPVGPTPVAIAIGDGAAWVASEATGTVQRIDLSSGANIAAISVGNGPSGLAYGGGSVWVTNSIDGTLSRIDTMTNSVTSTVTVGRNPRAVAVAGGNVWVADSGDGAVVEVAAGSGRIVRTVSVGNSPQAITATGNDIWATAVGAPSTHRGGTLRVSLSGDAFDTLDPATAFSPGSWQALINVYDGLVAFRRVAGAAGAVLVPDLAVALPRTSADGRTYAFQLRQGIRYSNGAVVRASDFRYALERMFKSRSPGAMFYASLAGAGACMSKPAGCNLSRALTMDDAARTVTFHLAAPDPDFLYKLALPFAAAIPSGMPLPRSTTPGPPGTGPYEVSSFQAGHQLRLVRNPLFRVWSEDAQPGGFPDTIEFSFHGQPQSSVEAVRQGTADWADAAPGGGPVSQLPALETRYAAQLHIDPAGAEYYVLLNNRIAPFDDRRVRQAVNFVVDRGKLAGLAGGTGIATPTCQVIPPSVPGYHPYCPYTLSSSRAGIWTASNFAKAAALVRDSGARGKRVVVWAFPPHAQLARYLAAVFTQIGLDATARILPIGPYYSLLSSARGRATIQAGLEGWFQDYPAPADFIATQFSCATGAVFLYCDRSTDRQIAYANRQQSAGPASADVLWTQLDRELVNNAAAVPLYTTSSVAFVSRRVGNYEYNPQWGTLLDQLWVR